MNDKSNRAFARKVNADGDEFARKSGTTLEDYARAAGLPVTFLEQLGLRTVDNPWAAGRPSLAVPYRRRDGTAFRARIWQEADPGESRAKRVMWDKREEKLGALLYGLDQLPASGCPVILVDDERACQILWHRGFDAIGAAGASGYYPKRDDPELTGLGTITVISSPAAGGLSR